MSTVHIIDVVEQLHMRKRKKMDDKAIGWGYGGKAGWLIGNEADKNSKTPLVFDALSKHYEFKFQCISHKMHKERGG